MRDRHQCRGRGTASERSRISGLALESPGLRALREAGEGHYHAGRTKDLHDILSALDPALTEAGIVFMGFSLGGNMLLKFLAESGKDFPDTRGGGGLDADRSRGIGRPTAAAPEPALSPLAFRSDEGSVAGHAAQEQCSEGFGRSYQHRSVRRPNRRAGERF